MKITWIGQAGLLIDTEECKIMVDPYLSNSCVKLNPNNDRRMPVKEELFSEDIDVIVITHNHLDHYDPETMERLLSKDKSITVLAPYGAWQEARKNGKKHNYVMFNRHTTWTEGNITFTAVKAEHSDLNAVGVIINDGKKKLYITGDTLYNEEIFKDLPNDIDIIFLPVN